MNPNQTLVAARPSQVDAGGIRALLRTLNQETSPLGPMSEWSVGLQTILDTILPAQAQIVLFWGADYVAFYNDAYAPTIGTKHPRALGRPAQESWSELWDDLEPLLRGVRETGETFAARDRPFYIERSGHGETAWFDVSYSAVRECDGSVGGVLCIVSETTQRVQFQRRQTFLLELAKALPGFGEPEQIERQVARRLGEELGAARVYFAEALAADEPFHIARDWVRDLPSLAGACHDEAGPGFVAPIERGQGREALLCVQFAAPRVLAEDECRLIEQTAAQTWDWITHARGERALKNKSAHLQATFAELMAIKQGLEERVTAMLAEREAAMLQLHEARKMETIGQLTGGIAHDFNNMLTPIIASLELMRRRPRDVEGSARLIHCALQAADRARNIVSRLLSFARRQTLQPQSVSLAALVEGMRELMARSLGPTIKVTVAIDERLPTVVVDPHQLELALLNLVINARDAMPAGGHLVIAAGTDDGLRLRPAGIAGEQLWLSISDDGCGMDDEQQRRCVEPFYSTKGVGKGTGLGLSMVQGLALQSGGGLQVRSTLGRGTEVTVWLPVGAMSTGLQGDLHEPPPVVRRSVRVLLVDDEVLVRQATALQLRDLGYEVLEAGGPSQAWALIEAGMAFDVLVTDQIMAEATGASFARELRGRCGELPVLIITGYTNLPPEALRGFEVLGKPFQRVELARSLERVLGHRR